MGAIDTLVGTFLLAMARFAPLLMVPAFTPFNGVPASIRMCVLLALTMLAVGVHQVAAVALDPDHPVPFVLAMAGECVLGFSLSLAVVLPMAALGFSARVLDIQSGVSAASLFNPNTRAAEALAGTIVQWAGLLVFFSLGLHLLLLQGMMASIRIIPLGSGGLLVSPEMLLSKLSSQFLLGLMVSAPTMLGLFAIDLTVAYASRSMPQANAYFVALPIKVLAGFMLLAGSLRYAPPLIERMYRDAFTMFTPSGVH
ncbi:MAG TPA: flagellar biosynthetic protein FliR [Dyella sp.]|uniref:flagellar biosynthetic protein FliR n=1 Tax=Dyella sp. TaxID=1869338 RepID=UPI002BAD823B|nr:flagellar biosynthetic protein FliR [Dyella sp.]HUB90309.1 flagellar biosynthetic protein FliR [Dyella sp.]